MKIICYLMPLLLSSGSCFAQLSFSASSLPQPGAVHKFVEGTAFDFPNSSQGNSWSFSTQPFLANDTFIITYKSISTVPESQYFPQANMVKERINIRINPGSPVYRDTTLYFYRYDNSGLYYHGNCKPGQQPPYPFTSETIEFPLPFSNGSNITLKDTSDVYYTSSTDSTWQRSYVTRKFEVISSGSLTMFGNSHQVLAMKYTYSYRDSIFKFNENSNSWNFYFVANNSTAYRYFFSPGLGTIVLKGEFYNTEGDDDWTISAITNPANTTSAVKPMHRDFIVYPNPSSDGKVNLKNSLKGKFTCRISDASGRIIQMKEVDSLLTSIEDLPPGEYQMDIVSSDGYLSFARQLIISR